MKLKGIRKVLSYAATAILLYIGAKTIPNENFSIFARTIAYMFAILVGGNAIEYFKEYINARRS